MKNSKKTASKKAPAKAAAKPAAPKPIKEALSKSGLVAHLSETSGVAARDVRAVMAALEGAVANSVHKQGAGSVTLRMVKACARCSITTTDQQRGAVDGEEPLKTLKEYRFNKELRGVTFGQNVIVVGGVGEELRVGQSFEVVWK